MYSTPAARLYLRQLAITVFLLNLCVVVLATLPAYYGYHQCQGRAEVTTQNLARALESASVNTIHRVDVSLLMLLDFYEEQYALRGADPVALERYIKRLLSRLPEVDALRIIDERGLLIDSSGVNPDVKADFADHAHFIRLRDDPKAVLVISRPQLSRTGHRQVFELARRITRPDGRFGGMILVDMALDSLMPALVSLDLGPGGTASLYDGEFGLIVRHPGLGQTDSTTGEEHVLPALQALLDSGRISSTFLTRATAGEGTRTVTLRKFKDYPLYACVGLASESYLAVWHDGVSALAALVMLFLLASLYMARLRYRAWQHRQESDAAALRQETRYHELVEDMPMLVVRYLPDTTITFANTAYAKFFDTTPAAILGKRRLDFIPEESDRAALLTHIAALSPDNPVSANAQHRVLSKDGQQHWTQWVDRAFFNAQGTLTHLQSVGEDITERKRTRDIQAARLRLMEFSANHAVQELLVATLDEAGLLTDSPIGFYHFLDADQKTLALQAWSTRTLREYCHAEGAGRHYDIDEAGVWVEAIRLRRPVIHNDYAALPNRRGLPPGHAEVLREMVVPVFRKGLIVAVLGVGNKAVCYTDNDLQAVAMLADMAWDFVEGKRLEAELVAMATTDFLTGLFNRRNFMARMEEELARLKRFDIERAAVLMLDLDRFKRVNDNFGHAIGDAVLKYFAALVREELRKIDTGGRLGGEEFALLLLGADLAAAEQFAERLRNKLANAPFAHEGQSIPVTVSIGITALEATDTSAEAALTRADGALYDAKRGGRNQVCVRRQ